MDLGLRSDIINLIKEHGTYERSTKLDDLPISPDMASSLATLAVSTAIFLFWMMDVAIYHKLLSSFNKNL